MVIWLVVLTSLFVDFYCFGPKGGHFNSSLIFWMSSGVQVSEKAVHVMMCYIFGSSPQRHKVSALSNRPHFLRLSFVRSIPVLGLFSGRQTGHASLWPGGSNSFGAKPEVLLIWFLHLVVIFTSMHPFGTRKKPQRGVP